MEQDTLYVCWLMAGSGKREANATRRRLTEGEARDLYRLRCWVIVNGEVRALLSPVAPLDAVVGNLWRGAIQPMRASWVPGPVACARLRREIEQLPVALGLTRRPEQWHYSSAATD